MGNLNESSFFWYQGNKGSQDTPIKFQSAPVAELMPKQGGLSLSIFAIFQKKKEYTKKMILLDYHNVIIKDALEKRLQK